MPAFPEASRAPSAGRAARVLASIAGLGAGPGASARERKYASVVNVMSLFVAAYSFGMAVLARSLGRTFILVATAQGVALLGGPVLNTLGRRLAAKCWFGGAALVGLTAASWVSGTASGMQLYLLPIMAGSWVVFAPEERRWAWVFSA